MDDISKQKIEKLKKQNEKLKHENLKLRQRNKKLKQQLDDKKKIYTIEQVAEKFPNTPNICKKNIEISHHILHDYVKVGLPKGALLLFQHLWIKDKKCDTMPFWCLNHNKKLYAVRKNDKWILDPRGEIILDIVFPTLRDYFLLYFSQTKPIDYITHRNTVFINRLIQKKMKMTILQKIGKQLLFKDII